MTEMEPQGRGQSENKHEDEVEDEDADKDWLLDNPRSITLGVPALPTLACTEVYIKDMGVI